MATLAEIRSKHPEYADMTDQQLADGIYKKYYSDMPRAEFDKKVGLPPAEGKPLAERFANETPSENVSFAPTRPDLENSTAATINGLVSAVPGLQETTDALMGVGGMLAGKDYGKTVRDLKNRRLEIARAAPLAKAAGEIAPTLVGATAAPELVGLSGSVGKRLLNSTLFSAGYEGAKGLAQGDRGTEALKDMGVGAATGLISAGAGQAVEKAGAGIAKAVTNAAQKKLTTAAIKEAPSAGDLADAASASFKAADDAGVTVDMPKFSGLVKTLVTNAKAMHIHPELDKKATPAFETLINALKYSQDTGNPLTLSDLHTLRQIAQKAAISSEGRDYMFSNGIVDALDNFVTSGKGLKLPANRLGDGMGANDAGNTLIKGITTWARSKRVGMIEEAMTRAQNAASGPENGLRVEFRKLLNNKKSRALFSSAELQAISNVANGNAISNMAKLAGMFGLNLGPGSKNVLGGTAGFMLGGPAGLLAATLARKGSEKLTTAAAERAAKVAATPNIPIAQQAPNLLAPARVPIELLIRGGAPAAVSGNR